MNILNDIDSSTDKISNFSFSAPIQNLSSLRIDSTFSNQNPTYIFRKADVNEARLVAPGNKQVCDDVLKRFGVNPNNSFKNIDKSNRKDLEDFYNRTVDLADICALEDVNQRINEFANQYQLLLAREDALVKEKCILAPNNKLISKVNSINSLEADLQSLLSQKIELDQEIYMQNYKLQEKTSILESLKSIDNQLDLNILNSTNNDPNVELDLKVSLLSFFFFIFFITPLVVFYS
ncbi:hypothetical protein AYI70_g7860 [Smittium culicis]|uniref:Uncharacterized protein n=1 Tax=Smittium culicis TaxID=133412 RepID=A0A1R1XIK0_9FUNG|nr:hypothetical protein AYI70_g7860 [Smittium culicis]